jgi:hypothetical protein
VARIFISYRRDDSAGWAGRLFDRLSQHFGRENVFMDIDTIEPGLDFVEVIEQAVGQCDALVALIGQQWLTITDDSGRRRLDSPEDFVCLEIAAALARNIRVIPALVQSARMPRSTELPDVLKPLARRNAIEISDRRFHHDVDQLIEVLDKVLASARPAAEEKGDVSIVHTSLTAPQPHEESNAARLPFEPEVILIPAGEFLMGSDPQQDEFASNDERPQHTLYLPDYYLARTPVTNGQYGPFVRATSRQPLGATGLRHAARRIIRWCMSPGMTLWPIAAGCRRSPGKPMVCPVRQSGRRGRGAPLAAFILGEIGGMRRGAMLRKVTSVIRLK